MRKGEEEKKLSKLQNRTNNEIPPRALQIIKEDVF